MECRLAEARSLTGIPLSLTEKILFSHLDKSLSHIPQRGKTYVHLYPDRVAMQDATAQMALLQFMLSGKDKTMVPATVHCDHLIVARSGAEKDLKAALLTNREVYDFLSSVCFKYGIDFWGPGSGIIHQIIFENYAFPGGLMIGSDSHTPNAGGLGMMAIGVGGADVSDVMAGMSWELRWPKLIGVKLTGTLSGWASAKDVILKLAGLLTVKGGTGCVIEYFGQGCSSLSATGKSTITNMGAEVGATASVFPYDEKMALYLEATGRKDAAGLARSFSSNLRADEEVYNNPGQYYDQVIEIALDALEPHLVGPFTPDLDRTITEFRKEISEKKYPAESRAVLIGSCTNSSYEDLSRAASVMKQAMEKGLKSKSALYISPGSERIRATLDRDGILKIFTDFGAVVLSNSCGPCIGQWDRQDFKQEVPNSIVTTFNRNFRARNDGNPVTLAFITSPELATAFAVSGRMDFNPLTDSLSLSSGQSFILNPPCGEELPPKGFIEEEKKPEPLKESKNIRIEINPASERLQLLEPFLPWDQRDEIQDCFVLVKVKGKCTTDHISPAGKWLKYRGHLDRISDNLFLGAVNAFTGDTGKGKNILSGETGQVFSKTARMYREKGRNWIAIGDTNYGEGSSREHAAMEPRFLGCRAVLARSFARIAETNLKKQGVLVATFAEPEDYERIREDDILTICGLHHFKPGQPLTLEIMHSDGAKETVSLVHSYSENQIDWFKAGSALNHMKSLEKG